MNPKDIELRPSTDNRDKKSSVIILTELTETINMAYIITSQASKQDKSLDMNERGYKLIPLTRQI